MPFVDLNSKKIYGCEENSRSWWHEKGHIEFDHSELGTRIKYYHYFFLMTTAVVTPVNFLINNIWLKLFTIVNGLCVLGTYLYEEIWCEIYARRKMRHNLPPQILHEPKILSS